MSEVRGFRVGLAVLLLCAASAPAFAQLDNLLNGGVLGQAGGEGASSPEAVASVFAHFTPSVDGRPAMLSITANIESPYYTYSTTQKPKGATPTVIKLASSSDVQLAGAFRSALPPKIVRDDGFELEEFTGEVTWLAPLAIRPGVDLKSLQIKGTVAMQICRPGTCFPPADFEFVAEYKAPPKTIAGPPSGEFRAPSGHVTFRGELHPASAAPGSTVNLVITAETAPGWHIYAHADREPKVIGSKPTLIALSNSSGFRTMRTQASSQPTVAASPVAGAPEQTYHEGRVTWTTPIEIPVDARPGRYDVEGLLGYQTCQDTGCDPPRAASFSASFNVGPPGTAVAPVAFRDDAKYNDAAKLAASLPEPLDNPAIATGTPATLGWSLPLIMLAGLLGGFILNFMPCVLPVIGLKVLSFAEQAGRSRGQILLLNVWYSLGTMAVFMVLATLASGFSLGLSNQNLGWGEQFTYTWFNIVMVGIVFVMALSFLGVWEIPIPGFVGSGKANELAAREGAGGAFSKGVLATILATPCSGPALGPVFGYTLNQPPYVTYLLFFCIALGMSSPYLLIGAFPRLIRFLPKPGAWMETFKQLMGFVLLGTIVFLFTFIKRDYFVATFAMMVGLWAACWWIGRTSLVETFGRKMLAWGEGAAVATLVAWFAFTWLVPHESKIPWQPFSQAELARLQTEGRTVLVDFTAEWCLTCKFNLATAINTDEVKAALEKHGIVPLLADWTDGSPEIKDTLATLQSKSIPVLAIYPAGSPNQPIILRDVVTKQQVLDAIAQAGTVQGGSKLTAARE